MHDRTDGHRESGAGAVARVAGVVRTGARKRRLPDTDVPGSLSTDDWADMVVFCAGVAWDGQRLLDQSLVQQLSRWAPVLYVDPPLSALTARRQTSLATSLEQPRLRLVGPRIARLTPLVAPAKDRLGMERLTEVLLRRAIAASARSLGGNVHAVITKSPHRYVFGCCGEKRRVYYAADDFSAGAPLLGLPARRLRKAEHRVAGGADLVVAVSPALAERWGGEGHRTLLVPNGCDVVHYSSADLSSRPADVDLPPPVAGFVGHISDRIDFSLLERLADRDVSVLLVGPRSQRFRAASRFDDLLKRPSVAWVGGKPFAELPSYMGAIDVGMVPYGVDAFNRASFPLKTLEYLAAGRPVVSTDLPSGRWFGDGCITVAPTRDAFVSAVVTLLAKDRTADSIDSRRAFAARHSWESRAESLARALELD